MRMYYHFNKNILLSMLLFPIVNLVLFFWNGTELDGSIVFLAKKFAICIVVALAEELFFRGLVLRELVFCYHWQPLRASLLVSFAFGNLHLLNVNSYATWGYAIVQSLCAFAISFNLCAMFMKTNSLFWCILIHALINITSVGVVANSINGNLALNNLEAMIFLFISFLYLCSGITMLNNKMVEGN